MVDVVIAMKATTHNENCCIDNPEKCSEEYVERKYTNK
jgi:hypothetical protein